MHPKPPRALRRAAVVPALAGIGLLLWSLPPPAAAAALTTRLPPPSSTVFECTVNGRTEFTDRPCRAEAAVEVVKVVQVETEIENTPVLTPSAAEVHGEESASYNLALMFASFACMAYLLRGRIAPK